MRRTLTSTLAAVSCLGLVGGSGATQVQAARSAPGSPQSVRACEKIKWARSAN